MSVRARITGRPMRRSESVIRTAALVGCAGCLAACSLIDLGPLREPCAPSCGDAGLAAPLDAGGRTDADGPTRDAGGSDGAPDAGPPDPGIRCQNDPTGHCDPATSLCCLGASHGGYDVCGAPDGSGCDPQDALRYCDDTADCVKSGRGGVCCKVGRAYLCTALTDCTQYADFGGVVCDPEAAQPCPSGVACSLNGGEYLCAL